ncbi:MAG: OsmC family protein [Chloroflexota bacterium]
MADKIRFTYEDLETYAEGTLDTRGRKGLAEDVPVHYKAVRLKIRIKTEESDKKLNRLIDLVARYCPVDSLIKAAVPDYEVVWERME